MNTIRNNLNTLNVGDSAFIHWHCSYAHTYKPTTITRKTKTQLTTADGSRWFIENGIKFGQASKTRGWFAHLETVDYYEETKE